MSPWTPPNLIPHLAGQADLEAHQGNTHAKDGKQNNAEGHDHGRCETTLSRGFPQGNRVVAQGFLSPGRVQPGLQEGNKTLQGRTPTGLQQ